MWIKCYLFLLLKALYSCLYTLSQHIHLIEGAPILEYACHVIVCNHFIPFSQGHRVCCWSQSQLSPGEGRVHPGQVASSSQGPQEQFGGSVSCSRTLAAQLSPGEPGFEPATNPATPSTSWPALPTELQQPLILEYSWFNLTIFSIIVGLRLFCHDDCHLYLRTILCSKDGGNQTKPVRLYPGVFCGFGIDRIKKYSLKIKIQELNWKKKPSVIPQQATEDKNLVCHKVN